MQMRIAKNSDVDNLVKMDKEASLTPWSKADYLGSLQNKQHFIYVLEEHGKILGCLVFGIVCDEAEILQFWINKNFRRHGHGRQLLTYTLNELKQRFKAVMVFLEVRDGNTAAINLYLNSGFAQVGKRNNYYNVDTWQFDAVIMQKKF